MKRWPVRCWPPTQIRRRQASTPVNRGGSRMRIAKVMAPRQIILEESPVPSPGPGEALVRIKAVGICGSDLQYYTQGRIGDLQFTAGHILGHEVAGLVEGLGPG